MFFPIHRMLGVCKQLHESIRKQVSINGYPNDLSLTLWMIKKSELSKSKPLFSDYKEKTLNN